MGPPTPPSDECRGRTHVEPSMKLTLSPQGIAGTNYELLGEKGRVGRLRSRWFGRTGVVQLGSKRLELKPHFLSSRIALKSGSRVLVDAERKGLFTRTYRIRSQEGIFRLETDGAFFLSYRLMHGDRCVGRIKRKGVLRRAWEARFNDDLSLELCAFVLFHLARVDQNNSATASPTG